MPWLPHFLNGWTALAAAGAAVPALLVLYFLKLRRRELVVSSTLLWRKAIQDLQVNSPFQRLRRNLLLFLQLLLLLLLTLALARPVLNYNKGAGQISVLLIDRSASMAANDAQGGRTRLDEAKKRAKDLVDTMGRDATAMVIAFDSAAETIQPFTGDPRALKAAIDSITQTDRKTALKLAYQYVEAQSAYNPSQNRANQPRPEVWLFSDGRASDVDQLSLHAPLKYSPIGSPGSKNVAIVAMSARRNFEQPTQVQVFARLANFGPDPVTGVQVTLCVNGRIRSTSRGELTLMPDRWTEAQRQEAARKGMVNRDGVEFPPLDLSTSAVVTVDQTARDNDVLSADDSASVVVPPPKPLSVLLVTDGNFALKLGLDAQNLQGYDRMFPPEYDKYVVKDGEKLGVKLPKPYDVIVFDKVSPRALPAAGNFIYFDALPPNSKLTAARDEEGKPVVLEKVEVLDWRRDHPILRGLNIGKIFAGSASKLQPTLDSTVLVDGTQGPLMVLHQEGRSRHLVMPFSALDTNWPFSPSWPAFLHNALQFMALGTDMDVRESFAPGTSPRIPRFNLLKMDPVPDSIALKGPDTDRKVAVPLVGDLVLPPLDHVGIYRTEPPVPGYEEVAVNLLDPNESNVLPAEKAPGGGADAETVGGGKSRLDLWWWIVAAGALPLMMAEWWVYSRRIHL